MMRVLSAGSSPKARGSTNLPELNGGHRDIVDAFALLRVLDHRFARRARLVSRQVLADLRFVQLFIQAVAANQIGFAILQFAQLANHVQLVGTAHYSRDTVRRRLDGAAAATAL